MGRISTSRRYAIDITGPDPTSLGNLEGGLQCFGQLGGSGQAMTMKIGRRVRDLYKLT